jgi:hypothetical protein
MKPISLLLFTGFLAFLFAMPASASRIAALQEFPDQTVSRSDGRVVSAADLARAARAAAERTGWTVREDGTDRLVASIEIHGKHSAEVDINLRAGGFDVKYRSSHNLNYRPADAAPTASAASAAPPSTPAGAVIHPNYNRKVKDLVAAIKREAER